MDTVDDKRGLFDALQVGKGGTAGLLPLTKRSHLRRGNVGPGWCVEVLRASCKPLDERRAGRLARCGRSKEDPLQHRVSLQRWVTKVLCQTRLLEVHNVFAASWRRSHEDHPADD